jgi:hypothetical protein
VKSFDTDPQTNFGSRSHFGTARELIVERSFQTGAREVNILGILFPRSGPTRRKSQPVAKSRMCSRDKHSRNKIMSAHPTDEFGAAYPSSGAGRARVCLSYPLHTAGAKTLATRSLAPSGLCLMPLCASDPLQGANNLGISRSARMGGNGWRSRQLPKPDELAVRTYPMF